MTEAVATIAMDSPRAKAGFKVGSLAAGLLCLFAADNLLLLHFLGLSLPLTVGAIFVACTAITILCGKFGANRARVPYRAFLIAFLVAFTLFALGGQGRFFYANVDWQVRDAVLRDMATHPWPFAYEVGGTAWFLRAPIGTYLFPAMFGAHAEMALLLWNSLRLALLLTLAWQLFECTRERLIALTVFILFSGWDVVGTAIYWALGQQPSWDHLEPWNLGFQYSSNVTLAFWVPQHAIAGWACAITFLMWRKGIAPIGLFAATIPLVAIWSPLAIMGAIPFAIFAGLDVLRRRAFDLGDVALAAVGVVIALPALLYMHLGASDVGIHVRLMPPLAWLLCALLEVLPFAYPVLRDRAGAASDRPVILLTVAILLVMPLVHVGDSVDFQMRASIMPLALLSVAFASWTYRVSMERPLRHGTMGYALIALALGAVTPWHELRRALVNGPSPLPHCSLIGVWHKQNNIVAPYATYLAPVATLPPSLRTLPVVAGRSDPGKCWDRKWVTPDKWPNS
jgi:hypothetical protein